MKKFLFLVLLLTVFICTSTVLVSCGMNDDENMPEGEMPMPLMNSIISFENVLGAKDFVQGGLFVGVGSAEVNMPVVLPGQSISFKFHAGRGQALMLTTMYGASKDWFFAPDNPGIMLYKEDGMPMTGDVSKYIKLWDNGTKKGTTDTKEDANIMMVSGVDASKLMKLELSYKAPTSEFELTLTNTSGGSMNETPFSPGAWVISNVMGGNLLNSMPFYKAGAKANPEITAIAEMGNTVPMGKKITENTGILTGISPILIVVYSGNRNPIYEVGKKDAGIGLKNLAQTGDVTRLKTALEKMPEVRGVYVAGNAPIGPGEKVEIAFEFAKNDRIAYATMFGYSNDWFYANESVIDAMYKGDVTSKTALFDNGTAVDQYPGAGNGQALFKGMSEKEDMEIKKVGDMYPVPVVNKVLKINIR